MSAPRVPILHYEVCRWRVVGCEQSLDVIKRWPGQAAGGQQSPVESGTDNHLTPQFHMWALGTTPHTCICLETEYIMYLYLLTVWAADLFVLSHWQPNCQKLQQCTLSSSTIIILTAAKWGACKNICHEFIKIWRGQAHEIAIYPSFPYPVPIFFVFGSV